MSLTSQNIVSRHVPSAFVPVIAREASRKVAEQEDSFAALRTIGTVAHFARNAMIFSDGDEANYFYRVVTGAVRLCKLMSDGRRQIAGFLVPGDFFGFEWRGTHSLSAEALTEVKVVCYARSRVERLSTERLDVQRSLTNLLSRDLYAAQNHLLTLGQRTAKERVVSFLLALAERTDTPDGGTLDIPMGRQDIADYLGLTIETVCRSLSELKRKRLIDIPDRMHIGIRNLEALHDIAEGEL